MGGNYYDARMGYECEYGRGGVYMATGGNTYDSRAVACGSSAGALHRPNITSRQKLKSA